MCVLNVFFMHLGPDFSRFGNKDISCRVRNRKLDKFFFKTVTVFFLLSHVLFLLSFLQHVSLTFFRSMSPQVLAKYF